MDPLSLTASIIAVISAARALTLGLNKLGSVRGASALLDSVKEEVSSLCAVLGQVEHGITHLGIFSSFSSEELSRSAQEPGQLLQSILHNAQQKLLQLRQIVDSCLKDASNGEAPKVRKLLWLRRQSQIEQLQKEVSDIRINLIIALTALNLWVTSYYPLFLF